MCSQHDDMSSWTADAFPRLDVIIVSPHRVLKWCPFDEAEH